MPLREALVGLIEEYARHMGHADLLRADRGTGRPVDRAETLLPRSGGRAAGPLVWSWPVAEQGHA
jgi:hypothetical protein